MSYLDQLRTLEEPPKISESAKSPSVKSTETLDSTPFDTFDTTPTGAFPKIRGIPLPRIKAAAGDDWPAIKADQDALEALALALVTRQQREHGTRPEHYTQRAHCEACGPVWLWEGAPARVLACPWCFNRTAGKPIPRPPKDAPARPALKSSTQFTVENRR